MAGHFQFTPGDTIGLIACSDGMVEMNRPKVQELIAVLNDFGLETVIAPTLFRRDGFFSGTPAERGASLNRFFAEPAIKAILDISGGDSANQTLPTIDFDAVREHPKPFFGMSDLSVILNALHSKAGISSYHYQALNMAFEQKEAHREMFFKTFFRGGDDLFQIRFQWIRGERMEGVVIGGNIRCFLKLAGTRFFPDFRGKLLFLESLGGRANRIVSLLAQLDQIGLLRQCAGILLGIFTELEEHGELPIVLDYLVSLTADSMIPIARTGDLGHGSAGKCIRIGEILSVKNETNPKWF